MSRLSNFFYNNNNVNIFFNSNLQAAFILGMIFIYYKFLIIKYYRKYIIQGITDTIYFFNNIFIDFSYFFRQDMKKDIDNIEKNIEELNKELKREYKKGDKENEKMFQKASMIFIFYAVNIVLSLVWLLVSGASLNLVNIFFSLIASAFGTLFELYFIYYVVFNYFIIDVRKVYNSAILAFFKSIANALDKSPSLGRDLRRRLKKYEV